jgi:hypothetical protein
MKRSIAMVLVLAASGCSKAKDDNQLPPVSPTAPVSPPTAAAPVDPPAGLDPHAGTGAMGGAPGGSTASPHGGGAPMGGGASAGGATLPRTADGRAVLGPFVVEPPASWQERKTSSSMRAAEWLLPGAKGAEDAELVVYYFGAGGAGGVEANLERWLGQFQQADGAPSRSKATIKETKVAGQKATTVEVSGRYVAAVKPGASETLDKPDWTMLAAIVESPAGAYYFKLVGPKATVVSHTAAFHAMLKKMELAAKGEGAPAGK